MNSFVPECFIPCESLGKYKMDLKMNSYDKCERMCHSVDICYENSNEYYSSHVFSTDLQKGRFRHSEEWTSLCSSQPGASEPSQPNMCCVSSSPLFQQYASVFYSPIDKDDHFFDEGFYAAASTNIISPPTVVRIVKRRNTANKKERRRTQSINTAFSSLRNKIPNVPADTKLSKIKTLRLATSYISYLSRVLEGDQDPASGFRAELISSSRKLNSDRRTTSKHEMQANDNFDIKKCKGRTGWPQHVWASELKQE